MLKVDKVYNPQKISICRYLGVLTKILDKFNSTYENSVFLGDSNTHVLEFPMISFCESYNSQNIIKQPTSFKNPKKSGCIDLILTNRPDSS